MYLIWALINAAFAILFLGLVLSLFTKGKKLFNNKYGNRIIAVFVLSIIGMLNASERDFDNTYTFANAKDLKGHNVTSFHTRVAEMTTISLHLDISFKKNENGALVASSSRSDMSGFISGHNWEYLHVDIDTHKDGTYSYEMLGVMHWYLFGIEVYTQTKEFEGTFTLPEY